MNIEKAIDTLLERGSKQSTVTIKLSTQQLALLRQALQAHASDEKDEFGDNMREVMLDMMDNTLASPDAGLHSYVM